MWYPTYISSKIENKVIAKTAYNTSVYISSFIYYIVEHFLFFFYYFSFIHVC